MPGVEWKKAMILTPCLSLLLSAVSCHATSTGSNDSAIAELETLLEADPTTAARAFVAKARSRDRKIDEAALDSLGFRLIHQDRIQEAVAVFRVGVELAPESWAAWDSLGEAYMYAGDKKASQDAYARSLEINPENRNAAKQQRNMEEFMYGMARETRATPLHSPGESTGFDEPYFGEEPPGDSPKVFAPGIVSTRGNLEYSITFSPDGRELFFTARIGKNVARMFTSSWRRNGWTHPQVAAFSKDHIDFLPYIMPDGKRLFFGRVEKDENGAVKNKGFYAVDKARDQRFFESRPYLFTDGEHWMHVSATRGLTIYTTYLTDHRTTRFALVDGAYPEGESLTGGLHPGGHPAIAPDESFVVFDSEREGGFGAADLWVAFRKSDGTWGEGINLGAKVNSLGNESIPHMTPDGQYLFYTANRDIYWVGTALIDGLR